MMGLGEFVRRKLGVRDLGERMGRLEEAVARSAAPPRLPLPTPPDPAVRELVERVERLLAATPPVPPPSPPPPVAPDLHGMARQIIARSSASSYFPCVLNGLAVQLPRDTLRTMLHCVFATPDGGLDLYVETMHLDWMRAKLRPGDLFLDVGSSTGSMTLPVIIGFPEVRVVAFEPARTARRLLTETLAHNSLSERVEVRAEAVSDAVGELEFSELGYDPSSGAYYLPETSRLTNDQVPGQWVSERYPVSVITLDRFFAGRTDAATVRVVKIDVEGYEGNVVAGAMEFLRTHRPYLAIDIHDAPEGPPTCETACTERLSKLGYTFERMGHVLLCSPH